MFLGLSCSGFRLINAFFPIQFLFCLAAEKRKEIWSGEALYLLICSVGIETVSFQELDNNEDCVDVLNASLESNRDMAALRENISEGSINNDMDEGSNRSSHDYLDGDNNMCWNILDRKSCFSCNEGGEMLVCTERDCPINLHAKCLSIEPKFDDKGNFYCPYCWYKRACVEAQESRNRAFLAKKDLSKFFVQNGIMSGKVAENDRGFETREPRDVSVMGNGSSLDDDNRPDNKSVHGHPLKTLQDQQKERERLMAGTDQHRIIDEDIAIATNGPEANSDVSKRCGEENTHVHIGLDHKSSRREEFDTLNNNVSKTNETRFVEGQAGIKLEDLGYNDEYVHAMIAQGVKPLSSFCFGESTDRHLPGYAMSGVMQGRVEVNVDKGRVKDRERFVQNELNLSAADCSVSGTGDSDSEPLPMKESHIQQEGQRASYTQGVPSVWASLLTKSGTEIKSACSKNEEAANYETLELPLRSSLRSCSKKLSLETGKRKRLNWTVEEVNMLKEGVVKFGMDQRSIPWKKILEFGCHVFHSKRNTADLKDKWKHLKF